MKPKSCKLSIQIFENKFKGALAMSSSYNRRVGVDGEATKFLVNVLRPAGDGQKLREWDPWNEMSVRRGNEGGGAP